MSVISTRSRSAAPRPRSAALPLVAFPDASAPATHLAVSVVIPAKNEARNIAWVLRRLPDLVDEVILVDGRSTDETVAVARAIRPDIVVVEEQARGKGAALRTGFLVASGDAIVMLDADGSMDPFEITRFVDLLEDGYEFVKGSRFADGGGTTDMTPLRRVGNAVLLGITNLLYGTRFSDLCYGYCAFRRGSLDALNLSADGFEIETQIVVRAARIGLVTGEVPSFEAPRMFGQSNLNTFRDGFRVLHTILRERLGSPPRPALSVVSGGGTKDAPRAGHLALEPAHYTARSLPGDSVMVDPTASGEVTDDLDG